MFLQQQQKLLNESKYLEIKKHKTKFEFLTFIGIYESKYSLGPRLEEINLSIGVSVRDQREQICRWTSQSEIGEE